ncbi:DUF1553 domain-containing protein [Flavivirga spongiicola]|uniref:DUF1553 domain-containing protein n=1 Tax=Flavivirga spongiicola TaxID=421621 RepID=A0ABU7XSH6_9FLAO|nr:DUF1553 domain-containing protein [Flavivirga sp. MEBiC05379]MDO5978393.1 DUF1553 domain-containing protein [Flavivirga sp. MEBiC05379]
MHNWKYIRFSLFVLFAFTSCKEERIDFNAQVRPILNKNCISCHGGVKQSGGFGLVFRENALGETVNGKIGIFPGSPKKSEMISRITHKNPEMRMPLEREPLSEDEIKILTKWIEQGAEWKEHWAYLEPKESSTPSLESDWGYNEIDAFVYEKMKVHNLSPNVEADSHDLVRRVYLDLIGLPPTTNEIEEFIKDTSDKGYEKLVDSLLESLKFGEHWASMWLDLARYADSKGYEADRGREIWKYRDWVIKALNEDMPFDQFTIEQLAGDLLPNPTKEQLIATAFHRNTLNNGEGGTDNEEYRISAVIDRVNTTWEIWQSTTMSCVQCHSHPYDPIKHKEYYTSFAFFNNTSDWDVPTEYPIYREFDSINQAELEGVKRWVSNVSSETETNKWEHFIHIQEPKIRPEDFSETQNTTHYNRSNQDYMEVYADAFIKLKDVNLNNIDRIYLNYNQGGNYNGTLLVKVDSINGSLIGKVKLDKTDGFINIPIEFNTSSKRADLYFQFKSNKKDYKCFIDGFLIGEKLPSNKNKEYVKVYNKIDALLNVRPKYTTPVMVEKLKDFSRVTRVFDRGNWLVATDTVTTSIPKLFNPNDNQFKNRLDLAEWLVSEDNYLTGRVIANRFWAKIFGKGIVMTSEDFGTLGDKPTHPELLDWLALSFSKEWKWSVKKLLKTIVLSDTYKQSSVISEETKGKDSYNQWLARSPRVRLSAEQIRDQALVVSGLLSNKMYGPSVMPHQPDGVWTVVYNNDEWKTSEGEDAYRRGLYTYLRRSSPYPSFISFDASERETCLSRRINTNTPLQALITLNDPVYFEAAIKLAQQVENVEGGKIEKVGLAYKKVMGKKISTEKSEILTNLLDETEAYYAENIDEAFQLIKSDNLELASLTVMVNALMNMDEFLVKN